MKLVQGQEIKPFQQFKSTNHLSQTKLTTRMYSTLIQNAAFFFLLRRWCRCYWSHYKSMFFVVMCVFGKCIGCTGCCVCCVMLISNQRCGVMPKAALCCFQSVKEHYVFISNSFLRHIPVFCHVPLESSPHLWHSFASVINVLSLLFYVSRWHYLILAKSRYKHCWCLVKFRRKNQVVWVRKRSLTFR